MPGAALRRARQRRGRATSGDRCLRRRPEALLPASARRSGWAPLGVARPGATIHGASASTSRLMLVRLRNGWSSGSATTSGASTSAIEDRRPASATLSGSSGPVIPSTSDRSTRPDATSAAADAGSIDRTVTLIEGAVERSSRSAEASSPGAASGQAATTSAGGTSSSLASSLRATSTRSRMRVACSTSRSPTGVGRTGRRWSN